MITEQVTENEEIFTKCREFTMKKGDRMKKARCGEPRTKCLVTAQ